VRPHDLILLPRDEVCARSWSFYRPLLGLIEDQVIWTPGEAFHLDADITAAVISELKARFSNGDGDVKDCEWLLLPYSINESFLSWASALLELPNVSAFGETAAWTETCGDKGILHRHMDSLTTPSLIETVDPTIVVPCGYVCKNRPELLAARLLLADIDVVIKPLKGATGVGIILKPSQQVLETYDFPLGPVNLEEFLSLDLDQDGEAVSPAFHYMGNRLVGCVVDQIMDGCAFSGWKSTTVSPQFQARGTEVVQTLLASLRPQGAGGVDFLSVEGEPVLTDINFARFNGCHPPKLFLEQHAPGCVPYIWNLRVPGDQQNCPSISEWYQVLATQGLAFVPNYQRGRFHVRKVSHDGVFPLVHIDRLRMTCVAIGKDAPEAETLMLRATVLWEQMVQGKHDNGIEMEGYLGKQEEQEEVAGKDLRANQDKLNETHQLQQGHWVSVAGRSTIAPGRSEIPQSNKSILR